MKIFFDQGTPAPLRDYLSDAVVVTAAEHGWSDLSNGDLITAAEEDGFDVFVTTDRNLQYQQNLSKRSIAIIVILQSAWPLLELGADIVAQMILAVEARQHIEV